MRKALEAPHTHPTGAQRVSSEKEIINVIDTLVEYLSIGAMIFNICLVHFEFLKVIIFLFG